MTVTSNQQATLNQGVFTVLHRARFQPTRVVLTGLSGEFTEIPFKITGSLFHNNHPFLASEAVLSTMQSILSAKITATTPSGVATLDIVYEVRTGSDA
jgi:hypothetical protein